LRQTSPEAIPLFDFIISLHTKYHGEWDQLGKDLNLNKAEVDAFLDYAACFLSNCGNYYVGPPA
jgi:dipeptidyl-peptidase-3